MSHPVVVAIRVDGDAYREKLRDFCSGHGACLLVRETVDGSNPHFHAVLHSDRKVPAIRMALKRALAVGGNGEYSVAEVRDLDKYQRYIMKGESASVFPQVVMAVGMQYQDPTWQQSTHGAYWAESLALGRKRKLEPVMDVVYAECTTGGVEWHQRDKISKIYIKELVARSKPINLFSIKSYINLLQCKLCPDDTALDNLCSAV